MNKSEAWRDIPGYEGLYQASDMGNIYSFPRNGTRGGILAKTRTRGDWPVAHLCKNNIKRKIFIHRLVMLAFVGPSKPGMHVNHKNGIKTDNRLENLEWATPKENAIHAVAMGLVNQRCDKNNGAKINSKIARAIYESDGLHGEISKKYGITESLVSAIKRGVVWRDATGATHTVSGLPRNGEQNAYSKLTEPQVIDIFYSQGTYSEIGARYGVTSENVYRIKKGKSWKYLGLLSRS